MPALLSFMPSKQVIISQETQQASIISVIDRVNLDVPEGIELPRNAVGPLEWSIHILLRREPDDAGKQFEYRTQILLPDGEPFEIIEDVLEITTKMHRLVYSFSSFPIAQVGDVMLTFSLREEGSVTDWVELARYALEMRHKIVESDEEEEPPAK